jgi:TPR repeat protein
MVENTHYRSDQSDLNTEDTQRPRRYAFGRTANTDYGDSVPLFLSDPDGEPDPEEYSNGLQPQRRFSLSFKLLMTSAAAACVAVLFAWFTSDATRDVMMSAKASIATVLPIPSTAAQAEASPPAQLTAADLQLKDPAQVKDPARWPSPTVAQASGAPRQQVASATPSREEITSAYQSALQSRAPAAGPAVVPPQVTAAPVAVAPAPLAPQVTAPVAVAPAPLAPQARRMDADELATLMKRAKESLAAGDIPVARLLLERAADGQDASAALMLAQTYDPAVLGTSDVRNITPEPDKARSWYQRAAQLGSADAQRRLAQIQN